MLYSLGFYWLLGNISTFRCPHAFYCIAENYKTYHFAPALNHKLIFSWATPSDIWGTIHATQYIMRGHFGDIYANGNFFLSLPGVLLLLIPVVILVQAVGLGSDISRTIQHPAAWLFIGPYEMLIGSLPLFALDTLAKRLGISSGRRAVLTFLEMAALWPLLAFWGHPEDAIALGIGLYGLMAAYDKRHVKAGWLFGAAIAVQPLVGLVFPIVFGLTEKKHWLSLGIQGGLPSALLLAAPIIQNPHLTSIFVFQQPTYPLVDHPTPWVYFAPAMKYHIIGHPATHISAALPAVVSAGPTRILAVITAFIIGYLVYIKSPPLIWVLWLAGLSLAFRCFFESVITPYYFWPAIALGILIAAKGSSDRFALTVVFAATLGVFSFWHINLWLYWLSMMALLTGVIGCSVYKGGPLEGTYKKSRQRIFKNPKRTSKYQQHVRKDRKRALQQQRRIHKN